MSDGNLSSNPSTLLRDVLIALEDLSFDTGGVWGRAPSVEVYNRTFDVLDRVRKALGVTVARNYTPDETTGSLGPREPDNDMVICPNCTSQFRAIPVNVQARLNADTRPFIGDVRRALFTVQESNWNSHVRDITAQMELMGWLSSAPEKASEPRLQPNCGHVGPDGGALRFDNCPYVHTDDL